MSWMIPHGYGNKSYPGNGEIWEEVLDPDLSSASKYHHDYILSGKMIQIRPLDSQSEKEPLWIAMNVLESFARIIEENFKSNEIEFIPEP
jgi:hypothetical protein